jgi:acetylornithine deacetylase/succinyl-diaminopimelate desuccinylase-like protein
MEDVAANRGCHRSMHILLAGFVAACLSFSGGVTAQTLTADEIHDAVATQLPHAFDTYRDLLSLPNDAHFPSDILRLLDWLEGAFDERGFDTVRLPTAGSPLLLAERDNPRTDKTVLIYLQSDGQPVDTLAWFQASAYQPALKEQAPDGSWSEIPWDRLHGEWNPDWRAFARSASDSKGPIAQFLAALDAMGTLGVNPDFDMKVIVDTEEEMGSPNLPAAVERFRERLAADMLIIFDGPPHVSNRPSLKFGARGIARLTITTHGPKEPVHSGHYGNYAPNPGLRLSQILGSMKDEHGRVTIPGWYDGIELDDQTRAMLAAVPDDEDQIRSRLGIAGRDSVGENLQEAVQYPSLNIRGLSSGWVGAQARTIVPATATAEVDIRLVRESDPQRLLGLVRGHVERMGYHILDRDPTEEERARYERLVTFTSNVSYAAFRTDFDSEPGVWLSAAFRNLFGEDPIKIRTSGGSIPISPFLEELAIPAVTVPTVNGDNNQHSPNENLRIGDFVRGIRILLAVLTQPLGRPAA